MVCLLIAALLSESRVLYPTLQSSGIVISDWSALQNDHTQSTDV